MLWNDLQNKMTNLRMSLVDDRAQTKFSNCEVIAVDHEGKAYSFNNINYHKESGIITFGIDPQTVEDCE